MNFKKLAVTGTSFALGFALIAPTYSFADDIPYDEVEVEQDVDQDINQEIGQDDPKLPPIEPIQEQEPLPDIEQEPPLGEGLRSFSVAYYGFRTACLAEIYLNESWSGPMRGYAKDAQDYFGEVDRDCDDQLYEEDEETANAIRLGSMTGDIHVVYAGTEMDFQRKVYEALAIGVLEKSIALDLHKKAKRGYRNACSSSPIFEYYVCRR